VGGKVAARDWLPGSRLHRRKVEKVEHLVSALHVNRFGSKSINLTH